MHKSLLVIACFLTRLVSLDAQPPSTVLGGLAHLQNYTVGRAGSYDRTGGNADRLQMKAGETATLA